MRNSVSKSRFFDFCVSSRVNPGYGPAGRPRAALRRVRRGDNLGEGEAAASRCPPGDFFRVAASLFVPPVAPTSLGVIPAKAKPRAGTGEARCVWRRSGSAAERPSARRSRLGAGAPSGRTREGRGALAAALGANGHRVALRLPGVTAEGGAAAGIPAVPSFAPTSLCVIPAKAKPRAGTGEARCVWRCSGSVSDRPSARRSRLGAARRPGGRTESVVRAGRRGARERAPSGRTREGRCALAAALAANGHRVALRLPGVTAEGGATAERVTAAERATAACRRQPPSISLRNRRPLSLRPSRLPPYAAAPKVSRSLETVSRNARSRRTPMPGPSGTGIMPSSVSSHSTVRSLRK